MVKRTDLLLRSCMPPLCAALGLMLSACSPQGSDFMSGASRAPAAPESAAQPQPPAPGPLAARRASTLISMPVQSDSGEPLGTIEDIVFGARGRATHVIVNSAGRLVAIPWRIAMPRIHGGILELNRTRLSGAPSFTPDTWPDVSAPSWSATADAYWTTPVDSMSRSRSRSGR
jgi:hypothetical protein